MRIGHRVSSVTWMPSAPTFADIVDEHEPPEEQLVDEEWLIEEISIDGMCGVY